MEIQSTLNRILQPVDKFAGYLGAGSYIFFKPYAMAQLVESVQQISQGQVHMPNISNMVSSIMNDKDARSAAITWALGYVAKEQSNTTISKLGSIAEKYGKYWIYAYLADTILYFATHSSEGCDKDGFVRPTASVSLNVPVLQTRTALA